MNWAYQNNRKNALIVSAGLLLLNGCNLTVENSGGGVVASDDEKIHCGDQCQWNYESETNVTLTASADSGYAFSGWAGECDGQTDCVVDMGDVSGHKRVIAEFVEDACVPLQTASVSIGLNLPASSVGLLVTDFSSDDDTSYNESVSIDIFDSLGTAHLSTLYYVKDLNAPSGNVWQVFYYIDGEAVDIRGGGHGRSAGFSCASIVRRCRV
ncbi:hypothetical protein A9Q99_06905 [Gammaproteobacteria bacterium 45_16_T64]|nr:hypothetical protein A9Q99_06905 [Gammaproteobacteria bacterium 45_16_T64]